MGRQSGLTLVELLAALAILGCGLVLSTIYLKSTDNPLKTGSVLLEGAMREARLLAIAETAAYRVVPQGTRAVRMQHADSCGAGSWTDSATPSVTLPDGVTVDSESWAVCFNSRGISSDNVVVTLSHGGFGTRRVEVLLGGTTRVLE